MKVLKVIVAVYVALPVLLMVLCAYVLLVADAWPMVGVNVLR